MLRFLLHLCGLLLPILLSAQTAPIVTLFEPVGNSVYNVASDVDGDGDLEVICATSKRLFWVERLDNGFFSKHNVISPIGLTYRQLTAADIDEDGDEDILYASQDGGFGLHLNMGNGEFGEAIEIYNPGAIIELFVADVNGDGHLDALVGRSTEARWLPGNGNGTFDNARLLSTQTTISSLEAADIDVDGDLDIVLAAINGDVTGWHENLGNSQFSDFIVINDVHDGPRGAIPADFDGDGLPDLVVANRQEPADTGAGLVWYRNVGDGNFQLIDTIATNPWNDYVHVADLDVDGDMDIVSCNSNSIMEWYPNDGNGNFGAPIELSSRSANIRFVETPDLNDDGFPDLLYGLNDTSPERNTVLWRASSGPAQFEPIQLVTVGGGNFGKPVLADMDRDGRKDIVIGSGDAESVIWFSNEGYEFTPGRLITRRTNLDPLSIAIADLNGDGWPDVVANSIEDDFSSDADFCVYYNNGDNSFTASEPFRTDYSWHRKMELIDMDEDGDLDMFYVNPGVGVNFPQALVGWVRNDGDSWSDPILIAGGLTNLLDVLITDFDEDGQMDLVLCKTDEPQLARMEHIGNGEFSSMEEIPSSFERGMYAQAIDIDEDGDLDLVATSDENGANDIRMAWWPNLGNGQFGAQQNDFEVAVPIIQFAYADFDLDGQKDIVGSTYFDSPMQIFRRQADGSFGPAEPIEDSPSRVRNFLLDDIDGDGDWDIVGENDGDFFGENDDQTFVIYNLANDESISGVVFNDLNANGVQDTGEAGIGRVPINVSPEAIAVFADEEGEFSVYGVTGTYTISPELEDCWTLTTTPETYEITFDGSGSVDSLRFGVLPDTETPVAAVTLSSAPTRCGFTVPFWLNYRNDGCWTFDGRVYMLPCELATFISATPEPSNIVGDTLFWDFGALAPGASRSIEMMMTMAGVEFLGETLEIPVGVIPFNSQGEPLAAATFDFMSVINCAYDPNDKQVYPNRSEQPPYTQNYTLFDEALLYTIRFQNTGTDTAFNIVLRDQLSDQLDWSTFRPGSSSHDYDATLHDDGLLEFHFRDILLPDSTTNEPASHGFVDFTIAARSDLDPGASIDNTAGIYFDFNPPIITNTVNSMMVDELPSFPPAAGFTFTSNGLMANFTDTSGSDPESWLWEFGDGATSTQQNPEHTFDLAGNYEVCLTATNVWGSSQYCEEIMVSVTSTNGVALIDKIQFHPNPVRSSVWVSAENIDLPQELRLYSAAGKQLRTLLLKESRVAWDLSELPAGSYWVRTIDGSATPLVIVK